METTPTRNSTFLKKIDVTLSTSQDHSPSNNQKVDSSGTNGGVPTPKAKFKQMMKKAVRLEHEGHVEEDLPVETKKKVSVTSQKLEDETQRLGGKAKSLGFHSIKAGLGRKEYEDFIRKSPIKPLALRMMEGGTAGGARRSILVRMKTEGSGILLPPINRSSRDITARRDSDASSNIPSVQPTARSEPITASLQRSLSMKSLENAETKSEPKVASLLRAFSMKSLENVETKRAEDSNNNSQVGDDYEDEFESSLESYEKRVAEEQALAKLADDNVVLPVAPFLLNELQAEDMIERRFGWRRSGNTSASHDARLEFLQMTNGISKSRSDDMPTKLPHIVKLAELSPAGSMKQSIRANMLGNNKPPPPGKLTRKATMVNVNGNPTSNAVGNAVTGGPVAEVESAENILEHYSGLLYRDPTSSSTWKDINSPKKTKFSLFHQQKQALSAGRNINAYRPWGPDRPIDPLDVLLEKSITRSIAENDLENDDRSRIRNKRISSRNNKSRRSKMGRNSSPFAVSPSTGGNSSIHRSGSNSRATTPVARSRVSSADGRPKSPGIVRTSAGSGELKSGLVLENSMELVNNTNNTNSIVTTNENSSITRSSQENTKDLSETEKNDSPEKKARSQSPPSRESPPSSASKRRSPLIINFIKAPIGLYE